MIVTVHVVILQLQIKFSNPESTESFQCFWSFMVTVILDFSSAQGVLKTDSQRSHFIARDAWFYIILCDVLDSHVL